jgi:glycosyltransferase involved in cell wall biosynthesis
MKKKLPKISIITPSFNQGQFIEETIQSVLSQKYPNLEYWVIDGGSTDNTLQILKKYEKKIHWLSEKDNGQTDAINKGLQKCTGEIIGYLNSDDLYTPGTLQTVGQYFLSHPTAMWLTGNYLIIDENGTIIQSFVVWYKELLRHFPSSTVLAVANFISQPSTFWRKEAVTQAGLFDTALQYCMDYEYWMRLYQNYSLVVLPNTFSKFRIHKQSKGGSRFTEQFLEEQKVVERYFSNKLILLLHKLHASAIVLAYKVLK